MLKTFYATFFESGNLTVDDLKEAVHGGLLSKEDYKEITGKAYRAASKK